MTILDKPEIDSNGKLDAKFNITLEPPGIGLGLLLIPRTTVMSHFDPRQRFMYSANFSQLFI